MKIKPTLNTYPLKKWWNRFKTTIETFSEDRKEMEMLRIEAHHFHRLIVQKYSELGFVERTTTTEKRLKIELVVATPDALWFKVMTHSISWNNKVRCEIPYGVQIMELVSDFVLGELSAYCGRDITADVSERGIWLELYRKPKTSRGNVHYATFEELFEESH